MGLAGKIIRWLVGLVAVLVGVVLLLLSFVSLAYAAAGICCLLFAAIINPLTSRYIGFLRGRSRMLGGAFAVIVLGIVSLWVSAGGPVYHEAEDAAELATKCSPTDAASCLTAAKAYDQQYFEKAVQSQGSSPEIVQAAALYEKACAGGFLLACGRLGTIYFRGVGVPQDFSKALPNYKQGCIGGGAEYCDEAAAMLSDMTGYKNPEQAFEFSKRSCDGNYLNGCVNLAHNYIAGVGVKKSVDLAHAAFVKACSPDGDESHGCLGAGLTLDTSDHLPQHFEQAVAYYRIACAHKSAEGCSRLGMAYMFGEGVARDLKAAENRFNEALSLDSSNDGAKQELAKLHNKSSP